MKSVVNLHNSCNESVDSTDEFSLSTGCEPKAHDFYETLVEPYVQLLDSQPLFSNKVSSADPDYDDTTLEDMLHQVRKPITLYEKTCLLVCRRRQCPIEQGDLLEIDRGDSVSTEAQKHRLGLCSTNKRSRFLPSARQELSIMDFKLLTTEESKKSKFLQNFKQELINTNFKQLDPKKSNDSFKDNYCSKSWNFVKLIKEDSLKWKN